MTSTRIGEEQAAGDYGTRAIVQVGGGRGFVVATSRRRLIITAAHCLPGRCDDCGSNLPPSHGASHTEERTYPDLLAALGEEPDVWAECLFVDPVADVAVLGEPDGQELSEECEAYEALTESGEPLRIANVTDGDGSPARLLSLDLHWYECEVVARGPALSIQRPAQRIESGMSGSPILDSGGHAIGIVCLGTWTNPKLADCLPVWLVRELGLAGGGRVP